MEYYLAFKKEILSYTIKMNLADIQPIPFLGVYLKELKAGTRMDMGTTVYSSVINNRAELVEKNLNVHRQINE